MRRLKCTSASRFSTRMRCGVLSASSKARLNGANGAARPSDSTTTRACRSSRAKARPGALAPAWAMACDRASASSRGRHWCAACSAARHHQRTERGPWSAASQWRATATGSTGAAGARASSAVATAACRPRRSATGKPASTTARTRSDANRPGGSSHNWLDSNWPQASASAPTGCCSTAAATLASAGSPATASTRASCSAAGGRRCRRCAMACTTSGGRGRSACGPPAGTARSVASNQAGAPPTSASRRAASAGTAPGASQDSGSLRSRSSIAAVSSGARVSRCSQPAAARRSHSATRAGLASESRRENTQAVGAVAASAPSTARLLASAHCRSSSSTACTPARASARASTCCRVRASAPAGQIGAAAGHKLARPSARRSRVANGMDGSAAWAAASSVCPAGRAAAAACSRRVLPRPASPHSSSTGLPGNTPARAASSGARPARCGGRHRAAAAGAAAPLAARVDAAVPTASAWRTVSSSSSVPALGVALNSASSMARRACKLLRARATSWRR